MSAAITATSAEVVEDRVLLRTSYSADNVQKCRRIKFTCGGEWNPSAKAWMFPHSSATWDAIQKEFGICKPDSAPATQILWVPGEREMPHKTFAPWKHQIEAFNFAYSRTATLLAHEMGVGKTFTAIALINAWNARRVLILCPLSVVPVWPKQFELHSPQEYNVVPLNSDDSVTQRKERAEKALRAPLPTAIVVNYEAARREPFASWALKQNWDVLIEDECHRLKSAGGSTSRFAGRLRDCAKHRLGLSGTPLAHSPLDAYGVCRALDVGIFGNSFLRFKTQWAVMGGYGGYEFIRIRDERAFAAQLGIIMHRVEKRDVLDLPPTVHEERYCSLTGTTARAYAEMEEQFVAWISSGVEVTATNALVKLLRLQQLTGGNVMGDDGRLHCVGNDKINTLKEFLEDYPHNEPLVIFARFVADVGAIVAACEDAGFRAARMTGEIKELELWQRGGADVLVTQIQVGSEGIDLTRASTCVFYSLGFSLSQYMQALARLDRPGQTRSVTYIHLLARGTVDEKVMLALEKRQDVVDTIINATKKGAC